MATTKSGFLSTILLSVLVASGPQPQSPAVAILNSDAETEAVPSANTITKQITVTNTITNSVVNSG